MAETDDARARRQRLLQRAFNNLGSVAREQQSAHPPPPTARLAPPPPPPAVPAVPAAAPAPSVPGLAPEDEALAKAIAEKCALAAKKDYFALLGVSKSATKDQLKSAYLSLVKTFHPDRMPPSLGHLASQAKDVFSAIREAHETLQDENRRKAWLASQQAGPAPLSPANAEKAAEWAVQGDLALKKREYARAAEFFGRAFSVSKASSHLALQAWSVYLDPERKAELPQVKSKLEEALKLDARCDRACYCLGVIARVENDLDRAERLFKQAIESNPRNAEASTELRLLQMRRRKAKA